MRNYVLAFLVLISGCKRREIETTCGKLNCPWDLKHIYISVVDKNGHRAKAAYIETHNLRTGKKETNLQERALSYPDSYQYKLFKNILDFSTQGDAVTVLIRSETGKEQTLNFVISGGQCTCNVRKVSGPDVVVID